jgi:hypothetical protein
MKLSNQAMGTLMMTLQKCLMDQSDITALLRELDFDVESGELIVENPPTLRFDEKEPSDEDVIMPREEDPYGNA